jgi:hypothetical protein
MVLQGWQGHSHAIDMQDVGKQNLKIIYNLQLMKMRKECKPKRLSWATYNALEREEGEGILHHYS